MVTEVAVTACGRLHMGFLDLHGGLGRQFGSIGVALNDLATKVVVSYAAIDTESNITLIGAESERAEFYAGRFRDLMGTDVKFRINVLEAITPHAGLGSGTQLALAVGLGMSRLLGRTDKPKEVAHLLGRGKRSSIGVSCFRKGGFVLDGGKADNGVQLPPLLSRLNFPMDWRLILVFCRQQTGVHGALENSAFNKLKPLSEVAAAHLCRVTLMKLLPGLVERDITAFGSAISEIQSVVGDHFAPVQGGRFASPQVSKWLQWFEDHGAPGLGQSSWGPTGFVVCPNEQQANEWLRSAISDGADRDVEIKICAANNRPGNIKIS